MALTAGTRLGPYEILAPIGAGGMGEVYKATDTRLDRTVAIKVLLEHLADSPERKARFEREAKAISQLNHPHICTLYDVGEQDGIDFIVMEHIEGETLAERLKKGALKLDEALEYGMQIADGLDTAHRAGIVHRDLKPPNVMLTKSGVKLLDFGLAGLTRDDSISYASDAPTQQRDLTQEQAIIGTLQYMAPEQLEAGDVDVRSDIWALGCVVYEMGTGRKAFEGKSQASLIADIMNVAPRALSDVQPLSPSSLDRLVARCLAKDADSRWQSARDVLLELQWIASGHPVEDTPTGGQATPRRAWLWSAAAGVIGLLAGILVDVGLRTPSERGSVRLPVPIAGLAVTDHAPGSAVALSPDGTKLAYVVGDLGSGQLYVRALDDFEPRAIPGAEAAFSPFFSPDGEWVAFGSGGSLMKARLGGAQATRIADNFDGHGGAWGADDRIVFGGRTGLWSVSARGGEPELLLAPDEENGETFLVWPSWLPGGSGVLFTGLRSAQRGMEAIDVSVFLFESAERKRLLRGAGNAHYLPTGQLVHAADGRLYVTPFDVIALEVTGASAPVAHDVRMGLPGEEAIAHYAVSNNGTLVYLPGDAISQGVYALERQLVWVDREGREEPVAVESHQWEYPRIAPDGRRAVISASDGGHDLWLWDIDRDTVSPLTFDPQVDSDPVWTSDGQRVVFSSNRSGGNANVYAKAADGTGQVDRLTDTPHSQTPTAITPDGQDVLVRQVRTATNNTLHLLSLKDPYELTPLVTEHGGEVNGVVSPNGRWLAFQNLRASEIYIVPFPNTTEGRWLVTDDDGGSRPLFGPDNKELFYLSEGRLMVVTIEDGLSPNPGRPRVVAEGPYFSPPWASRIVNRTYDITPDGRRLLMVKPGGNPDELQSPTELHVVFNWFEELKQLVPTEN